MIALLFAALACAATLSPVAPLWTLEFPGKQPSAAFFDASSGSLVVGLREKAGGSLAKVSLEGKILEANFSASRGAPGPLRAFGGKVYWISGDQIESRGDEGTHVEGTVPAGGGAPTDLAIDRHGAILVGTSQGNLVRFAEGQVSVPRAGKPITGLLLTEDSLQILRGSKLERVSLLSKTAPEALPFFCEKQCEGLERTGKGRWLTVNGRKVIEVGAKGASRTLYRSPDSKAPLGRLAYVYQMNPDDDFFVVPFPLEGVIRAFRVNAARK